MTQRKRRGPVESTTWPTHFEAHVVDATGPEARLHGYKVFSDLVQHHSFAEVLYLTLQGELPSPTRAKLFEAALGCLAATSVADATAHAALLARITGVRAASLASIACISAAEHGAELFAATGNEVTSRKGQAKSRPAPAALRKLARQNGVRVGAQTSSITVIAKMLWETGLRHEWQFVQVAIVGRLGVAVAEANVRAKAGFGDYPMHLPPIRYERPR